MTRIKKIYQKKTLRKGLSECSIRGGSNALVIWEHTNIHNATALVRLLERCDAWCKPQRFEDALLAAALKQWQSHSGA